MRRGRLLQVILLLLSVGLLLRPSRVFAQEPGVAVSDREFLHAVSKRLGIEESKLASGRVSLLKGSGSLVVFLDGTEIGRFEKARAEEILSDFPEVRAQLSAAGTGSKAVAGSADEGGNGGSGGKSSGSWWSTQDKNGLWRRLGSWDENLTLGYGLDYSYSGVLVRRSRTELAVVKKVSIIYIGGEVNYLSFKGELPDSVPYAAKAGKVGGGARLGFDFIRYHLQWAPYALPEYFWTESDLRGKYFARSTGSDPTKVVKIFENTSPPSLAHSVEAKLGVFRYTVTLAPDIYKGAIHYVAFDDLPGFWGTWGMGVVMTPDGFIPGGWYRLAPLSLPTLSLGDGIPLHLGLGRISYSGADRSQFRVAWNGELIFGLRSKERK